jgi:tripartite-type tricarboxylate transporter receptor subunit TctC
MKLSRRDFQRAALGFATLPFAAAAAWADDFPSRPIRLIVGFPAGSGPDIVARIIGQGMSEKLGQSVVVEDRPGAGSNMATADVAHSPPDGYMLMLVTTANVINATLYTNLNYDFARDITPVGKIDTEPFVLEVSPSVAAKTLPEFIAFAKANPGKVTMASAGIGSAPHIFGEMFQRMAGIQMTHVPYRGNPLPDLLSGQVDCWIGPVQSSLEYIRTGKLRALGLTTTTRLDALPDLPVIADTVPGFDAAGWLGIGAAAGTPPDIIAKLNKALNAALGEADIKTKLGSLGDTPSPTSTEDFGKLLKDEIAKWGNVIHTANIKLEQ